MANDCLVTKLKGVVNNDALNKLGELSINIDNLSTTTLRSIYLLGCPVKFSQNMYFKRTSSSSEILVTAGTEVTMTGESTIRQETSGPCKITLTDKYNLITLAFIDITSSFVQEDIDLTELEYCDKIAYLTAFLTGNLAKLEKCKNVLVSFDVKTTANSVLDIPFSVFNYPNLVHAVISMPLDYSIPANVKFIGDIHDIVLNPDIRSFSVPLLTIDSQVIDNIANRIKLTLVQIKNTELSYVTQFAAAQVTAGRTSGTCLFKRLNYVDKTINYGTSMVNPTEEETARGWQIV